MSKQIHGASTVNTFRCIYIYIFIYIHIYVVGFGEVFERFFDLIFDDFETLQHYWDRHTLYSSSRLEK